MRVDTSRLQVRTENGVVAGAMADESIRVFKGIPYAAPPVGPLRWRPPQPAATWAGVRPAVEFGADCPQPTGEIVSRAPAQGEDCLYLNIWSPADAEPGSLPVMVYIHGGSYLWGSGSDPMHDGTRLARHGVVLVNLNYRVGLFGFLAHPGLTRESPHGSSSNYALLDQIAALRWIQANIAGFGGDPSRVTAFGVSAGSASISLLLASPLGKGLFQQAILESPGAARNLASLSDAEAAGRVLGDDIDALRRLPAAELFAKTSLLAPKVRGLTSPRVLRPIRDGWVLPEDERPVFKSGRIHPLPLIVGTNADEGTDFVANWPIDTLPGYVELVRQNYAGMEKSALALYPAARDADVRPRVAEMFADTQFNYGARLLAQAMAASGQPTWRYLFTRRRPHQVGGPQHCDELPYVWGNFDALRPHIASDLDQTDAALQTVMMKAWVSFAATGNPNHAGMAGWPRYDAGSDAYMAFGDEARPGTGWRGAQLDFLDAYYAATTAGSSHG